MPVVYNGFESQGLEDFLAWVPAINQHVIDVGRGKAMPPCPRRLIVSDGLGKQLPDILHFKAKAGRHPLIPFTTGKNTIP